MISVLDRVENIVGKGENAGYQHFLLFPQCFLKTSFVGSKRLGLCGKGAKKFQKVQKNFNTCLKFRTKDLTHCSFNDVLS